MSIRRRRSDRVSPGKKVRYALGLNQLPVMQGRPATLYRLVSIQKCQCRRGVCLSLPLPMVLSNMFQAQMLFFLSSNEDITSLMVSDRLLIYSRNNTNVPVSRSTVFCLPIHSCTLLNNMYHEDVCFPDGQVEHKTSQASFDAQLRDRPTSYLDHSYPRPRHLPFNR